MARYGTELVNALRSIHGADQVIASDINSPAYAIRHSGPFEVVNVMDKDNLHHVFNKHQPTQVYLLAAILSAVGEQKPKMAWDLNMTGLLHVLDFSVEFKVQEGFLAKLYRGFRAEFASASYPPILRDGPEYGLWL